MGALAEETQNQNLKYANPNKQLSHLNDVLATICGVIKLQHREVMIYISRK